MARRPRWGWWLVSQDAMAGIVISRLAFVNAVRSMRFRMTAPAHATENRLVLPLIIIGSISVVRVFQFPLYRNWPWHPHSFEATVLDENCIFRGAFFARSSHTSWSVGTTQKIGWWQPPRPCEAKNFIAKLCFFAFEGPDFFSVSMWGMKFCM